MKNKYISKLIILTCLLIASSIKAQNFYSCIPDEDWFENELKQLEIRKKKEAELQRNIFKTENWQLIHNNATSGVLEPGFYYVIVGGGKGGDVVVEEWLNANNCKEGAIWYYGATGGSGDIKGRFIFLKQKTPFYASIGRNGEDFNSSHWGSAGGDRGSGSSFTINGETINSRGGSGASAKKSCRSATCDYLEDGYQRYFDIKKCYYTDSDSSNRIFHNLIFGGCNACVHIYKARLEVSEDIIKILLKRNS